MKDEYLELLLEGHRPDVKRAIRAAFRAAESDKNDPRKDYEALMQLGNLLASGAAPPVAIVVAAVGAAVSLLRYTQRKRRKRINKSRRDGMSAGLSAYRASRLAGPGKAKALMQRRRPWR